MHRWILVGDCVLRSAVPRPLSIWEAGPGIRAKPIIAVINIQLGEQTKKDCSVQVADHLSFQCFSL